jgi:hypothetical protein
MANLTHAWADHIFNHLVAQTDAPSVPDAFVRLFSADPGKDQNFTAEAAGGSYTGQSIAGAMGAPTNGAGTSTTLVAFANMPAGTWTHYALCLSAAGVVDPDEAIITGTLITPRTTVATETLQIGAGDLDLTVT